MKSSKYWKLLPEPERFGTIGDDVVPAPEVDELLEQANHIIGSAVVGNNGVHVDWRILANKWQNKYEGTLR